MSVKKVGIYLVGCPSIARQVERYFENLWKLVHLNSSAYTKSAWDQQWQTARTVPCWSRFLCRKERCRSPLPKYVEVEHVNGYPLLSDPDLFHISIDTPGWNYSKSHPHSSYLSFAPPELLFGKYQTDEQAWVDTVKSVGNRAMVRISTMDWLGQSQYLSETVYWSASSSAISEVKEVGIYLVGCPSIARQVERYFENLWKLAHLNSSAYTKSAWDQQWQTARTVPCWSHFLRRKERCRMELLKITPSLQLFLLFGKYQTDEQAWVDTVKSVGNRAIVRISTMDWLGQSQYLSETVYWSALSSAISEVVYSKHAKVKLLVAYWSHFINGTDQYLKSLLYTNNLCSSSKYKKCRGKVEIKYYIVSGFKCVSECEGGYRESNSVLGEQREVRQKWDCLNGTATENVYQWDYFYTTAGVSFGTYNVAIVSQLQEIFDADSDSPYAMPVEPLGEEGHAYSS
ncbi:hypothetical protein OROMI_020364 [Orobanche minor]